MPPTRKRRRENEPTSEEGRQTGACSPSLKRQNRGLSTSETSNLGVAVPEEATSSQLQGSGHFGVAQNERSSSSAAQVTQDISSDMDPEHESEAERLLQGEASSENVGRRHPHSVDVQGNDQNLHAQLSTTATTGTSAAERSESGFPSALLSRSDVHIAGISMMDTHSDSSGTGAAAAVEGLSLEDVEVWGGLSEAEVRRQINLLNALEQRRNRSETPSLPQTPTSPRVGIPLLQRELFGTSPASLHPVSPSHLLAGFNSPSGRADNLGPSVKQCPLVPPRTPPRFSSYPPVLPSTPSVAEGTTSFSRPTISPHPAFSPHFAASTSRNLYSNSEDKPIRVASDPQFSPIQTTKSREHLRDDPIQTRRIALSSESYPFLAYQEQLLFEKQKSRDAAFQAQESVTDNIQYNASNFPQQGTDVGDLAYSLYDDLPQGLRGILLARRNNLDSAQIRERELMQEAARLHLQRGNIDKGKESANILYEAGAAPSLLDPVHQRLLSHPALIDGNSAEYDSTWRYSASKKCIEATVPMAYWMNNPNTQPVSTSDPFFKNFPSDPMEANLTRSGRVQMVHVRLKTPEFHRVKTDDEKRAFLVKRKKIHRKQDWTRRPNVDLERGWYRKYRNRTRDEDVYDYYPAALDQDVDSFARLLRRNVPNTSNVMGSNPTDILNQYYMDIGMEEGDPGDTIAGPSKQKPGEELKKN
ncbi:hypothetical protein TWF694_006852 [Orbilia ellipsospora]|uniref:Uncharacterized protein n=1 Tax=Orbilia ellipsospora TaxID=2528407 RepID=A0AAV9XLU1_9PEZI